jgi:hypothetical protein
MAAATGKDPREDTVLTEQLVADVARQAAVMQGVRPEAYDTIPKATRESFERGAVHVMAALEALGWTLFPPTSGRPPPGRPRR